jgi:hypothetical protein
MPRAIHQRGSFATASAVRAPDALSRRNDAPEDAHPNNAFRNDSSPPRAMDTTQAMTSSAAFVPPPPLDLNRPTLSQQSQSALPQQQRSGTVEEDFSIVFMDDEEWQHLWQRQRIEVLLCCAAIRTIPGTRLESPLPVDHFPFSSHFSFSFWTKSITPVTSLLLWRSPPQFLPPSQRPYVLQFFLPTQLITPLCVRLVGEVETWAAILHVFHLSPSSRVMIRRMVVELFCVCHCSVMSMENRWKDLTMKKKCNVWPKGEKHMLNETFSLSWKPDIGGGGKKSVNDATFFCFSLTCCVMLFQIVFYFCGRNKKKSVTHCCTL